MLEPGLYEGSARRESWKLPEILSSLFQTFPGLRPGRTTGIGSQLPQSLRYLKSDCNGPHNSEEDGVHSLVCLSD
ncbi:hypothetical protein CEXT_457131 [Caerostris extrusa]|uniref:Uncharacterized protein n=1 Tax=Caerostris extrusa TaxID=172846 RepID=A0AAV4U5C5_CAEEX|nr:hypothetical protein CEXT_457131 [Caerostris extrusa]